MNKSDVMKRAWEMTAKINGKYSKTSFAYSLKKAWVEYRVANTKTEELTSVRLGIEETEGGYLLTIKYDFNFTLTQIKDMDGRKYIADKKAWFVPESSKSDIVFFTSNW